MAFAFTRHSGIGKQVRNIAGEQIAKALEECGAGDADLDKTVHELRRRCKKLRGLLRLIEPRFKSFKAENRAFRDAANGLAGARDAAVMIETFDALVAFDAERGAKTRLKAALAADVKGWLEARIGNPLAGEDREQLLEGFVRIMQAADKRVRGWPIGGEGFARIGDGLEQTYRQMRDGLQAAGRDKTAEALHDWRKSTKYHWHHVGLFENCAPDLLGARKELLDTLGELLGDHHNLAVFSDTLGQAPDLPQREVNRVRAAIADRQADLSERAFALGHQLAAEEPEALRRRFEQYWALLPAEK